MDFFTIVSLVIAVSGSTYAALAALQHLYRDSIQDVRNTAKGNLKNIEADSQNTEQKKIAAKKYARMQWWFCIWLWTFFVPVVLFMLVSYVLAIHVCFFCPNTSVMLPNCWNIYRCIIAGVTIIDFLCILLTVVAYWQITANAEDVQGERKTMECEKKLRRTTAISAVA